MKKTTNQTSLSFDDILLEPRLSDITLDKINLNSNVTRNIISKIPIISAAMDTVTESSMALALAQSGALGVIHRNMSIDEQALAIDKVKKSEAGIVLDPYTILPDRPLSEVVEMMKKFSISGIPVVDNRKKLVGIITNRDIRFAENFDSPVKQFMTSENLITVLEKVSNKEAKKLLHKNRIEKLIVVNKVGTCVGLITCRDLLKLHNFPNAIRDKQGRLCVGAAIGTKKDDIERAYRLVDNNCDVLVIDSAHGNSKHVVDTLKYLKKTFKADVIAGNVVTEDGAKRLIDNGADGIKVGVGPGSICTTRIIAGVGVAQFSAIINCADICYKSNVPLIADGGVKFSGDAVKALAAGASSVMIGSILAGTDEAPGDVFIFEGRSYKSYRGMGSIAAMKAGASDRYHGRSDINSVHVPEGIEGRVPYRGSVDKILEQFVGGIKSGFGYLGAKDITTLQKNTCYNLITNSGLKESHAHDVYITKQAPNYQIRSR